MAAYSVGAGRQPAARPGAGPAPITQAQRDQGAKEGPAAIAAAKAACTMSEAMFIASGTNPQKQKINFYEVSCKEGLGYIIEQSPTGATAYNCITIAGQAATEIAAGKQPSLNCRLSGNADPKSGLAPFITATGRACTVTNARAMGATAAGESYYEAACEGGTGYVIKTAAPGSTAAAEVMNCIEYLGTASACSLTTKD